MPAKYSHVKKRSAANAKKSPAGKNLHQTRPANPSPHADRALSTTLSAVSQLERTIARILLLRYEHDIARLFSTRLHTIALLHLPTFALRCAALCGPSWVLHNADSDVLKDFFRTAIAMDMRQAGERVATKSVLWSYTALRHFAIERGVPVCRTRGLHSVRLLPHYAELKKHAEALEGMGAPNFTKPPHLGSLQEGWEALEEACSSKYAGYSPLSPTPAEWNCDWRPRVRLGYEKLAQTLWRVAREFDVRGYGLVLREKLTSKWCECGCSTDHLGEVCERTVREDEEGGCVNSHGEDGSARRVVRLGKQREWDGRGSGIYGWETEEEEDIWEVGLDFGAGVEMDPEGESLPPEDGGGDKSIESEMTIGELMEWRYVKAEREKEEGNTAFRAGDFARAVVHYEAAHNIEPELPTYQLNLAAAHLKLGDWIAAEAACTKALAQHRSGKGYFRRARARRMLGRTEEAIRDLRAILKLQPGNTEAIQELLSLVPPPSPTASSHSSSSATASSSSTFGSSTSMSSSSSSSAADPGGTAELHERLGIPKTKPPKPLPFARTRADDRRLKVVLVPAGAATTNDMCFHYHHHSHAPSHANGHTCDGRHPHGHGHSHSHGHGGHSHGGHTCDRRHPHLHARLDAKGKGKTTVFAAGASTSTSGKALEAEMLRVLEAVRGGAEGVGLGAGCTVPSWDRYVVKRVD